MKFSKMGQEKCDHLIQVTAWAGLTIYIFSYSKIKYPGSKINHGGMNTKCLHR